MAESLALQFKKLTTQPSEDPTRDAPASKDDGSSSDQDDQDIKMLLDAVKAEQQLWAVEQRAIIASTLEAIEFLKGNHFFDFWDGTTDIFNSGQAYANYQGVGSDSGQEDEDLSLSDEPTNFFQMLFFGYQATLSADIPRDTASPENADEEEDRETAEASSTVMEIIAKKNKARKLHLAKLFHFWTAGHYWEYTRYVVDAERFKTHKETVLKISKQQVVPDRFVCPNCGTASAIGQVDQSNPKCPNCGSPLSEQDVYPGHMDEVPVAEEQADVPNGMVVKTIHGPLHVVFKPKAMSRDETPFIDLRMEASLGWLRDVFPDHYSQLRAGMGADEANDQQQRQARQVAATRTAVGYSQATIQTDPTYSRLWVQPWHFSSLDDQAAARRLKAKYPKGCFICRVGDLVLQKPVNASIAECWTHASTCEEVALPGIPAGGSALPIQKRFNNLTYMVDDFFERMAAGLVIANSEYIDTKQLNNKGLLPGVFNPVALRKGMPPQSLASLVHQFVFELEPQLLQYLATLPGQMQALTGVMPQIIGDDPGSNVQTKGGQAQQLATAKGRLNLQWNQIREQSAESSEQAVSCAARNMTEKWWNTVTDKSTKFRNEYVHPDQMKGSVHVEPEEDQGFPMTMEQMQEFWERILNNTDKAIAAMLFSEPENVSAAIRSFGVKGLIAPGTLAEARALHLIDLLMQGQPTQEMVPVPGAVNPDGSPVMQSVDVPSIQPDMYLDDLENLVKIIPTWAQKHFDKWEDNESFHRNLTAFYKLGLKMQYQKQAMMAKAIGPPPGAQPPPKGGQPQQAGA